MISHIFLMISLLGGCRKRVVVEGDNNKNNIEQEGIAAPVESKVRLVEVLPSVVDIGVRMEATVMGTGFQSGANLYIGSNPVALTNVRFQGSSVLEFTIPALTSGRHNLRIENPDQSTHTLYGAIEAKEAEEALSPQCETLTLYFPSAESVIDPIAQEILDQNQSCFDNKYRYYIEGHCDDRGTTEYNISLGQRRADILENYLLSQGILPDHISTISYGEERPISQGSNEENWSKNRRAVIMVQE